MRQAKTQGAGQEVKPRQGKQVIVRIYLTLHPARVLVAGLTAALLAGLLLLAAPAAHATGGQPLGIEQFTIQTTERTEEIYLGGPATQEQYEFINKPYTFTQAGGHPWALTTTGRVHDRRNDPPGQFAPTQDPGHRGRLASRLAGRSTSRATLLACESHEHCGILPERHTGRGVRAQHRRKDGRSGRPDCERDAGSRPVGGVRARDDRKRR